MGSMIIISIAKVAESNIRSALKFGQVGIRSVPFVVIAPKRIKLSC